MQQPRSFFGNITRHADTYEGGHLNPLTETDKLPWVPVRPGLTEGVVGKTLRDGSLKVVLTKVVPGGHFSPHCDPYDHLFVCLGGNGILRLHGEEFSFTQGAVISVAAGEEHAYRNETDSDLLLISMNIPAETE